MTGGFAKHTVNVLLGLAIIGLLVLVVYLVKKHFKTIEGFFQSATAPTTKTIDIDTYMNSVAQVIKQDGALQQLDRYSCDHLADYQLRQGRCYPECEKGFIGVADTCVPITTTGVTPREEKGPICPTGYQFDLRGPRDPECTSDGSGGTPICAGCTKTGPGGSTICTAQPFAPTCFPICRDKMMGSGSKCLKPEAYSQRLEQQSVSYSCPTSMKTRYIRIEGVQNMYQVVGQLFAITRDGVNVALRKPTRASSTWKAGGEKNVVDGSVPTNHVSAAQPRWYNNDFDRHGWVPIDGPGNPTWWEVDLGEEFELAAVTVFNRRENEARERSSMESLYVNLLNSDRKVNISLQITRKIINTWRLLDTDAVSQPVSEAGQFLFKEFEQTNRDSIKRISNITFDPNDYWGILYWFGNSGGIKDGLLPNASKGSASLCGTTLARYILIDTDKVEYFHCDQIEVFETDGSENGKPFTITPNMVISPDTGTYQGPTGIQNNLRYYHSNDGYVNWKQTTPSNKNHTYQHGTNEMREKIGWVFFPFIWIDLGREMQIERIKITNRKARDLFGRMQGFVLSILDTSKVTIWVNTLTSADIQDIRINNRVRQEYGVCSIPCPVGYTTEQQQGSEGVTNNLKCILSTAALQLSSSSAKSYDKAFVSRIESYACRNNVKYDRMRFSTMPLEKPSKCTSDIYVDNSGGTTYYYCDINENMIIENARDIINPINNTCGGGYSLQDVKVAEEVFHVSKSTSVDERNPTNVCAAYGARVATVAEITDAYNMGADWCEFGRVSDNKSVLPTRSKECSLSNPATKGILEVRPYTLDYKQGVNCYGIKPPPGTGTIIGFNKNSYYSNASMERSNIKKMCVRKLPRDNLLETQAITVDYRQNKTCAMPCQDGYTINRATRMCEPNAKLATYWRETSNVPPVSRIRIDSGADFLHIQKIRIFDTTGANINSRVTVTSKSNSGTWSGGTTNLLNATPNTLYYHSDGWNGEFLEFTINPATKISRIEIDNRADCCYGRLATYTLRVYSGENQFFTRELTGERNQIFPITNTGFSCPTTTEYVNALGKCYGPCTDSKIPVSKYCYPPGTIMKKQESKDAKYEPISCPSVNATTKMELRSDGLCYPPCRAGMLAVPGRCLPPPSDAFQYGGNYTITMPNVKAIGRKIWNLQNYAAMTKLAGKENPSLPGDFIPRAPRTNADTGTPTDPNTIPDIYYMYENMAQIDPNTGISACVNLMNDWIEPPPAMPDISGTVTTIVYGLPKSGNTKIDQEIADSLSIARRVYLGSPNDVDKFITVRWDDLKPYIRSPNAPRATFCVQQASQVLCTSATCKATESSRTFNRGELYVKPNENRNTDQNKASCNQELTTDVFALFSAPARNFISQWIVSRTNRMTREKFNNESNESITNRLNQIVPLKLPPSVSINLRDKTVLDSLAQTFYEYTNGKFIMTYIYDAFTLGETMLDIRFDITQHEDEDEPSKRLKTKMDTLSDKYSNVINTATTTQDIVDEAKDNYQSSMADLQMQQTDNTVSPQQGMMGRFFYTIVNGKVIFNGFTLDAKVVTSFIPELNCGLITPTGTDPGNTNYSPKTRYTKNKAPQFSCTDPRTVRRMMTDYQDMMSDPESSIAYPAGTPQWDMSGTLVVTEVTGATTINGRTLTNGGTQCAMRWKESIYDDTKNAPVPGKVDIERRAIFTYNANQEDWYANEVVFDLSGFRFLTKDSVGDCKWDWQGYKDEVGTRLYGADADTTLADYKLIGMRENRSPCPAVNPGYVFDPDVYINVVVNSENNNDLVKGFNYANDPTNALLRAKDHFFTFGYKENRTLSSGFTIATLASPIRLTKPLPAEERLTKQDNPLCPTRTCQDMEVLYALIDDYNTDASQPGAILRVTKATTPSDSSCHIEADINWSVDIDDPTSTTTPKAQIKKGATIDPTTGQRKTLPAGKSGIERGVKIELAVDIDPSTCEYSLGDDADFTSAVTIQPNTPFLFKPFEYATETAARQMSDMNTYIGEVNKVATDVLAAAKKGGLEYRGNTYAAASQLPGGPSAAEVAAAKVTWPPPVTPAKEGFQGSGPARAPPRAWDPLTVAPRPASSAGPIAPRPASSAGPIAPPVQELRALQAHAFGRDSARNMATQRFDIGDMYSLPLAGGAAAATAPLTPFEMAVRNQSVGTTAAPLYKKPAQVGLAAAANENPKETLQQRAAYKYLRFRPLYTRESTAAAVALSRITLFYGGSEIAINQARVTNPMGDWAGQAADVAGGGGGAGFRDVYKKALVFAFPQPILVDGFSFTTARGPRSAAEDPVAWKLEASHNGTFWQVLHDQSTSFPVPAKRGADLPLFKF